MSKSKQKKPLYSAYILDQSSRSALLKVFTPQYKTVLAHHITVQFGNVSSADIPDDAVVKVIGYVDSTDGLEALVVSVNGQVDRPDGSVYHVTWSLSNGYKPVDSNKVIKALGFKKLGIPIYINTTPTVVHV